MSVKQILVIEDNFKNMKLVRSLLKLGGYAVLEAGDAEQGLEMAHRHRPDLILMDIQLPGMDGLAATKIIKADDALQQIPVVAFTSYAMRGDDTKGYAVGCDGYISKPLDTRSFLDQIRSFLQGASRACDPGSTVATRRPKVLIVDDVPTNVKLLEGKLASCDYEILRAFNGEAALETIRTAMPDLILLDVMMPGIDGYEVTRRVKQTPQTQHIPIILVTALDGAQDKVRGLEVGAEEFLTKPVNRAELLARVRSMLKLKRYREQLLVRTQSEKQIYTAEQQPTGASPLRQAQRVLLVEDDQKDIKFYQTVLQQEPFELVVVQDGVEALHTAMHEKIDLILLDILLPRLDGFEVCQKLKSLDQTKDIQIALITCLDDLDSKIKGVQLGADDFLIKPVDPKELLARVSVLLKKKAYVDQLHAHREQALNAAIIDGLTQLYNHAFFKQFLALEIKRSQREGHAIALIMVDVDDFKTVNDNLGHMTGDIVLREIAQIVKSNVREIDVAARYGGEEFVVVLPYTGQDDAADVAERIRKAVHHHAFPSELAADIEAITVSCGVAAYPSNADSADGLVSQADAMLYKAKRAGKNRVEVVRPASPPARMSSAAGTS
jgi:two-component system cell cycle response regulator